MPRSTPSRPGRLRRLLRAVRDRLTTRVLVVGALFVPLLVWLTWTRIRPHYHHYRAATYNSVAYNHLNVGRLREARLALQNSFRHEPGNAETWRLYGWILSAEQSPDAPSAFWRALELQPGNARIAQDGLVAATRLRQLPLGRRFAETTRRFPDDAALWNAAGLYWQIAGDPARARHALEEATRLDPASRDHAFNLAVVRSLQGDATDAAEAREELARFARETRFREAALAALASAAGRTNTAASLALWDQLADTPAPPWTARVQAIVTGHTIRPDDTPRRLRELLQAAKLRPQRTEAIQLAARLADPDLVLTLFDTLAPADQADPAAFELWANLQVTRGGWAAVEARADETLAVAAPGDRVPLLLWKWRALLERATRREADPWLDQARGLAGKDLPQTLPAGVQLIAWGFPAEAEVFLELGAAEGSPVQRMCLGVMLDRANRARDLDDMERLSRRLLVLEPDNPVFLNNSTYAALLRNPADPDALARAAQLPGRFPDSTTARMLGAWSQFLTGRLAESLEGFESLATNQTLSAQTRLRMAEVFAASGRTNLLPVLLDRFPEAALFPEERPAWEKLRPR